MNRYIDHPVTFHVNCGGQPTTQNVAVILHFINISFYQLIYQLHQTFSHYLVTFQTLLAT